MQNLRFIYHADQAWAAGGFLIPKDEGDTMPSLADGPHVVKWGAVPYDLHDTLGRLKRSDFNYFFKDRQHGLVAGYWEAEDGREDLGRDEFHEFLVVLEGNLYVLPEGETEEIVAGPGDTVIVVAGRRVRLTVREPVKAFFVCYPMSDLEAYEAAVKQRRTLNGTRTHDKPKDGGQDMTRVFFNYSIDCELPRNTPYTGGTERQPFFHGPKTWEFGEASVRGFGRQMDELGCRAGASLFVYPDVARHQQALYRELADAGVETALHLNGLRYSRFTGDKAKWLGAMTRAEQREALRVAKEDLEQTLGRAVTGYRACYGSANADTQAICDELGFTWASNASGRYRPEFAANWSGSWPFAHHASRHSNLICGDLNLFEVPVTAGLHVYYDEAIRQPLDLRVETPPDKLGANREKLRKVIAEHLVEMDRRQVPVRTIIGASHNTNPYGQPETFQAQNLDWVVRHTRELAAEHGLAFTPASFAAMRAEADRVGSY